MFPKLHKISLLFGILIITGFIYLRFIKKKTIGPIEIHFSIPLLIGILISILIYIFLLYKIFVPTQYESFFTVFLKKLHHFYKSSLIDTYIVFRYFGGAPLMWLIKWLINFWLKIKILTHTSLITIIKYVFPNIIALVFMIEVCFFKTFTYFPLSLLLILPNICLDIFWFILLYEVQDDFKLIKSYFDIEESHDDTKFTIKQELTEDLFAIVQHNMTLLIHKYINLRDNEIPFFSSYSALCEIKNKKLYLFIRYFCWLIGWVGMLIYLLIL